MAKKTNIIALIDDMTDEEIYQARLIVARVKFWTADIEKLLRRWLVQINKRRQGHAEAQRACNKKYYIFGLPTAILSTVVASGILVTFKNCDSCSGTASSCSSDEWIRLLMGILSIISLVATAIMLYMDFGGARQEHKDATDGYDELSRNISGLLTTPTSSRGDAIEKINEIRRTFDDIKKSSPSLSKEYDSSLTYRNISEKKKKKNTNLPALVNTTDEPPKKSAREKAEDIASMVVQNIEKVEKEKIEKEKILKHENDYSTDDEGKEVAVGVDIDSLRPGDILQHDKKTIIQDSLAKALEFELERLTVKDKTEGSFIRKRRIERTESKDHIEMIEFNDPPPLELINPSDQNISESPPIKSEIPKDKGDIGDIGDVVLEFGGDSP
jgi:hypothetical protein